MPPPGTPTPKDPALDPFDAAVLMCVGAAAFFALLLAGFLHYGLINPLTALWPVFLALSGLAWVTVDTWAPPTAPRGRQLLTLAGFVLLEALTVAPLVGVGCEAGGLRVILAAGMAALVAFSALVVFALTKSTTHLEPIDPIVVLGITIVTVVGIGLGFNLPVKMLWATPMIPLSALFALQLISDVSTYARPGQSGAGSTRLFACLTMLFAEFVYYFAAMVRGEGWLWELFLNVLTGQ